MILGQKANLSDYSSSKWVVKQWRQLATSTMHLTQELLMNIQCSDGSRSFAKETTALKMSSVTGHHSWQWPTERIVKADPLRTTEEVAQELNVKHSIVVWHWKQTGKVITLHKWVPHELTENKKKTYHSEVSSSLILHNHQPFFKQIVIYDEKWILYDTSNDQLSGWNKKQLQITCQSQICLKKWSRSLFRGLLPVRSTTVFWILAKPLHLRSMFSK